MYIRTKDGVYEFQRYYANFDYYWVKRLSEPIAAEDILNQSENLEELCDRYVGISNNKPMIIKYEFDEYYDEYEDAYTKEELLIEYNIIYGAIYTDKGLIYVAKMNDRGDLELI